MFGFNICDPLEQFDIIMTSSPITLVLTNLNYFLLLHILIVFFFFYCPLYVTDITYTVIFLKIINFVKGMLRGSLPIKRHIYFPMVFSVFLFILIANFFGMAPYSFTPTSSIILTFFIASTFFIGLNLIGILLHGFEFFKLFVPSGVPALILPVLFLIEVVSYFSRVFSLSIRLFSNMMSGHTLLKILISFCWVMLTEPSWLCLLFIFPWVIISLVIILEFGVAFLQAYVFTILLIIYLNDAIFLH